MNAVEAFLVNVLGTDDQRTKKLFIEAIQEVAHDSGRLTAMSQLQIPPEIIEEDGGEWVPQLGEWVSFVDDDGEPDPMRPHPGFIVEIDPGPGLPYLVEFSEGPREWFSQRHMRPYSHPEPQPTFSYVGLQHSLRALRSVLETGSDNDIKVELGNFLKSYLRE